MQFTEHIPGIPLQSFKRTKIIATIGPASAGYEQIRDLIKAGANGLRLNFSHGTYDEFTQHIKWIREASKELDKPVAIIQDLQGPKIRCGDFEGAIQITAGELISLRYDKGTPDAGQHHVPTQYNLAQKVKPGERLYLYDGRIRTVVERIEGSIVYARAENSGTLIQRKGINLPDTDFGGDVITSKDRRDLAFGATQGIDYVAQSFVQTPDDLHAMRQLMQAHHMTAKLIAKVETKAAIEHMEAIVQAADVIMVARGDLAGETSAETVPLVQRELIGLGMKYARPTIIATQMLLSMTSSPEPTRAEVSDVATAVLLGADCVMLSEETAVGSFPIDTVKVMKRIIRTNERSPFPKIVWPAHENHARPYAIASAANRLAEGIQAKAIVAETKSGATAIHVATCRPSIPLIAVTDSVSTAQQLAIVYSVKSYVRAASDKAALKLGEWLGMHDLLQHSDIFVAVSGKQPGVAGTTDTIKVREITRAG